MTAFTDDVEELWFLPLVKLPASTRCPFQLTGQRAAGITSRNLYKEGGCHLQSSVNRSPSSCGMVCSPVLDRSMEGQPEDDLCTG